MNDQKRTLSYFLAATLLLVGSAKAATTIDRIRAAGHLRCGVITEPLDWNKTDLHGNLAALDAEICRAVATALLGEPDRAAIQPYNVEEDGFTAIHDGQSDIVVGVTPGALSAEHWGVSFSVPFFEDGQGFMVHRAEGIHALADIAGHKLCYIEDTDNDPIVLSALVHRGIRPIPFGFQEEGEMDAAIMDRHCQATSALLSKLAEARATFHNAHDYVFLPDLLALVPLTAAVDAGDQRLAAIVNTTISALLEAEFLGVTKSGAPTVKSGDDPRMKRLLGDDYATAVAFGLPHDWSRRVIAAVGNYAEIYARSVGPGTPDDLPRGINALWNRGGILAPLPLH